MAKKMHTLEQCLIKTIHHVLPHKVTMIAAAPASTDRFADRFKLVRENTEAALAQIKKIREKAELAGCKEVLDLLDEQTVPAGHDLATS